MRSSSNVRRLEGWALCVALAACGRADAPVRDTGAAARIPLEKIESFGSLASRREAQGWLDAAREAIVLRRSQDAAISLADAATFLHDEARGAPGDAGPALERAAEELDSLAGVAALGNLRAPKALDRVYANVHAAEALLHLVRANGAMVRREAVRAGEEIVMSVDHLERAAKHANAEKDSIVRAAIADARSLADEMVRGMEAVPDEAAKMTDEIERAVRRIGNVPGGTS